VEKRISSIPTQMWEWLNNVRVENRKNVEISRGSTKTGRKSPAKASPTKFSYVIWF
jgi:hypothetical protein